MPDFNERLLIEIGHLRSMQENEIESDRITHCLEMLRFIRNTELHLTFAQGWEQENEWIENNTNSYTEQLKVRNNFIGEADKSK